MDFVRFAVAGLWLPLLIDQGPLPDVADGSSACADCRRNAEEDADEDHDHQIYSIVVQFLVHFSRCSFRSFVLVVLDLRSTLISRTGCHLWGEN